MMKHLNKLNFNVICKTMAFFALCANALFTPTTLFADDSTDGENYIIEGVGSKNFVITKDAVFGGQRNICKQQIYCQNAQGKRKIL